MSNWRTFPSGAWSAIGKVLSGFGNGEGAYGAAYAIEADKGQFLNGRVSARIQLASSGRVVGAGVVARADELRSFIAFYVVTDETSPDLFSVRLAAFKHGKVVSLIGLREAIRIKNHRIGIALQFFSGDMVGQVVTESETYTLKRTFSMVPFPGWAGVVRFYGSSVISQDIQIEKITMKPILDESSNDGPTNRHLYHAFLSHSSADDETVLRVVSALKTAGISYWTVARHP